MSKDCTRSHPHELMDCCCEHKTEIARANNRISRLEGLVSLIKEYEKQAIPVGVQLYISRMENQERELEHSAKENAKLSAFPVPEGMVVGLTKREAAAIQIMAGFAAAPDTGGTTELVAEYAVAWADALFSEMESSF